MRAILSPFVLGLALLGLSACNNEQAASSAGSTPAADIGEVIATVNGINIGSKEFEQAAAKKPPKNGESLSMEEKKEVLEELVAEKLLYAEALKKGIDKDPKVQKVMVNTLLRDDVYGSVKNNDFSDEVLQKYYEDHKAEFIVPEKVQVRRILVKVSDTVPDADAKAKAEKLRTEVTKDPESFKDVAARDSEDPFKRRGGDLGFVSKDGKPGLDQAVVEKAMGMEVGAISEVFKTSEGYNILQVVTRREQMERTFQQMKGAVLRKVKNEKMKSMYDEYVQKLRTGANTQIEEGKLAALEVKSARMRPGLAGLGGMGADGEEGGDGELTGAAAAAAGTGAAPIALPPGAGAPGAAVAPGKAPEAAPAPAEAPTAPAKPGKKGGKSDKGK